LVKRLLRISLLSSWPSARVVVAGVEAVVVVLGVVLPGMVVEMVK
jgi:hypothetical protein